MIQLSYSIFFLSVLLFFCHVDFISPVTEALWYVFLCPLKQCGLMLSTDSLSTASSCSNKFISLHIKDQASYTHAEFTTSTDIGHVPVGGIAELMILELHVVSY